MDKNKLTDKLKEGLSVKEIESFTRKHTTEVFSIVAIIIATISTIFDFFTGRTLTILFTAIGFIVAVLFPVAVERWLKHLYNFTFKQEKTTQLIIGAVQIVVAIFIPFILFGLTGLLAGSSYHYYVRHAQMTSDTTTKTHKGGRRSDAGEHD